jgi:cyclohexyl-isocyanide hydratase
MTAQIKHLEYNPAPPFNAGSPETAGEILVDRVHKFGEQLIQASLEATKQTAARLGVNS